ncbi:MAG TPA: hypothetical protein VIS72_14560 [Anaerolineales bacterium]
MSQPDANQNEPSKLKKLLNGGGPDESPMARLPRGAAIASPIKPVSSPEVLTPKNPTKTKSTPSSDHGGYRFLPAFWTIASVMSFAVNIVLILVLAVVIQNLNAVGVAVTGITDHLLGGLYTNFVKMDQAHIKTTIPVSKEIPVQFTLNVSGPTNVTLSENVVINGARVTVNTGGLNINNALANIVLPQGTVLPIYIENLVVPVNQKVLAELNVEVDIPLSQTDLHEPFVGLQEVVEPFYCLVEQQVLVNGANVCP